MGDGMVRGGSAQAVSGPCFLVFCKRKTLQHQHEGALGPPISETQREDPGNLQRYM